MLKIISFIIMFGFGLFAQDTSQTSKSIDIVPLDLEEIPDAQDEGNFISLEKHNEVLESLMDSLKLIKTDKSDIKILEKELLSLKDSLTILQSITHAPKSVKIDTIYSTKTDTLIHRDTIRQHIEIQDSICLKNFQILQFDYDQLNEEFKISKENLKKEQEIEVNDADEPDPKEVDKENKNYHSIALANEKYNGKKHIFFRKKNILDRQIIANNELYMDNYFPEFHSDTLLSFLIKHYTKKNNDIAAMLVKKHLLFFKESTHRNQIEDIYLANYAGNLQNPNSEDSILTAHILNESNENTLAEKYKIYLEIMMKSNSKKADEYLMTEFQRYENLLPSADYDEGLYFQYSDWLSNKNYYKLVELANKKFEILFPESELLVLTSYRTAILYRDKMNNYDKALDEFQRIIDNFTDTGMQKKAYSARAFIYRDNLKDNLNAVNEFDKIIKSFPESKDALTALLEIADIHKKYDNNSDLAITRYIQLQEMFPNNIKECYAAKEAISELYQKDKNWEKCYEATMDIVRTYPEIETNAKYLFNAGNIKADIMGNPDAAIELYQEAADKWSESKYTAKALSSIESINKTKQKAADKAAKEKKKEIENEAGSTESTTENP